MLVTETRDVARDARFSGAIEVTDARAVGGVGVNTPEDDITPPDKGEASVLFATLWRRDGAIDAVDRFDFKGGISDWDSDFGRRGRS
jgi:hypothetical protein